MTEAKGTLAETEKFHSICLQVGFRPGVKDPWKTRLIMQEPDEHARLTAKLPMDGQVRKVLDNTYTDESRRILATLIRLIGNFDVAEDAFAAAAEQWVQEGIPSNPRARELALSAILKHREHR